MLVNKSLKDRATIPFHVLSKAVGASCNLACKYCYYPQESHSGGKMSDVVLEQFIKEYITKHPTYSKSINFVWQGGEPMLAGISFYKKVLDLQKKYAPKDVHITNSLQTNGILISDEWSQFFKDHQFIIGVSLDGDAALNDLHRVDKQGRGTHSNVIEGIRNLSTHYVEFNLLVVVHDEMVESARQIYQYFVELGVRYIQFQPLTSGGRAGIRYQLSSKLWGQFLADVYDEWRVSKHVGKVFITNIENSYMQYFTQFSPTCVHSAVCGNQLALETDGNIYACDHLIDHEHYLGNLDSADLVLLLNQSVQMPFGKHKSARLECQSCQVKLLCEGGCPTHIDDTGRNSLCEGYLHFFGKILQEIGHFSRDQAGLYAWQKTLNNHKEKAVI